MIAIHGMQMIYTRVEPEYSPHHKSDYQTVYSSKNLSINDVRAIERRVASFQTADRTLVRYQFFVLESGNVVLTHSVLIESHPLIIDRSRRGGVFLAHCLILTPNEFKLTDYNPFKVFDAFTFLDNPQLMIEQFNQEEGREPPCRIEIAGYGPLSTGNKWGREVTKLVALAEQAGVMKAKSQSVLLLGSRDDIDESLRLIFHLVPMRTRLACSFDTHIDRSMVPTGLYWAVGAPTRQSGSFILVDISARNVIGSAPPLDSSDLYFIWLQHSARRMDKEMIAQAPVIQELNEAFQERRYPKGYEKLDQAACASFLALHKEQVMQDLTATLSSAISPNVGAVLANYLLDFEERKNILLSITAAKKVPPRDLSKYLRNWLVTLAPRFAPIKSNDWKEIYKIARRANDHVLVFWLSVFEKDNEGKEEALEKMTSDEFREALALLSKPIKPVDFVIPPYLNILIEAIQPVLGKMDDEEFVGLIKAVVAAKGMFQLDGLAGRVSLLENKALTYLENRFRKSNMIHPGFIHAMQARRRELGTSAGLREALSSMIQSLTEKKGLQSQDAQDSLKAGYPSVPPFTNTDEKTMKIIKSPKRIVCPYCLTENRYRDAIEKCEVCSQELPPPYVQKYDEAAPFYIQIIGWSQVGKTVYLQAMTLMLMQMARFWKHSFTYAPLTQVTREYTQNVRDFEAKGVMPPPTQMTLQQAYIMQLQGMERWGGRTMVIRDVAGGIFNDLQFPLDYVPYFRYVPTTFLMISLHDLKQRPSWSMDDLMHSYLATLAKHRSDFRRENRKVVIVLSKADLIFNELPANLRNYLVEDAFLHAYVSKQVGESLDATAMQHYMDKLKHVSRAIEDWIGNEPSGQNMINLAKSDNVRLEFTIISSTGENPESDDQMSSTPAVMRVALQPARVLDPFFWALDFQSQ